jgi:hypothetical protein
VTPFEELNQADRECAIDCAVAATVLAARIPNVSKPLFDYLIAEFAAAYNLPQNSVRYALRDIGQTLYDTDWGFLVTKKEEKLITLFVPAEASSGDGGMPPGPPGPPPAMPANGAPGPAQPPAPPVPGIPAGAGPAMPPGGMLPNPTNGSLPGP